MDIAAYNQNTHQWKYDYNLFPLNPNWQYKLVNGKPPGTFAQCPLSDNPADWKSSKTCTSQDLHYNDGQVGCTDLFSGHGGHMNWFPVTEVGILNFNDWSNTSIFSWDFGDDDYNFYLQSPDSSLYLWSDDPDPMNQYLALEFDSDEFPDPVDDDYDIWWNHFHDIVTSSQPQAQQMVKNKLAIVTGMAGIDIGHDNANQATTELHPVYGMFILTDEQTSVNPDGSLAMNDTWSFFIRNIGNEGYCGPGLEYAVKKRMNVFIPEMPYYYAGTISSYNADPRDHVTIDDRNVHITNWNGVTDNNSPQWEHWTTQPVNGGVILAFNFDSEYSEGIFTGDIKMNWNVHISFNGFDNLRKVNKFVDESKFKDRFKNIYNSKRVFEKEYETKEDSILSVRLSRLTDQQKTELQNALAGKIHLPGMPNRNPIQKEKSIAIRAGSAGKDSINTKQFNGQVNKFTIKSAAKNYKNITASPGNIQNQYVQRKMAKRNFIEAYLKSKQL